MIELLQWLLLNQSESDLIALSQKISNLLLLLYILSSAISGKYFFIFVFVVVEVFGVLAIASGMHGDYEFAYYISLSSLYCLFYWSAIVMKCNVKILFAYGIMILFQSAMAIDAYIFQDIETLIYSAYEYVVLAIHLYIIAMLIQWRALIRAVGAIARSIADFLNIGYAFAFCYNAHILHNKK